MLWHDKKLQKKNNALTRQLLIGDVVHVQREFYLFR